MLGIVKMTRGKLGKKGEISSRNRIEKHLNKYQTPEYSEKEGWRTMVTEFLKKKEEFYLDSKKVELIIFVFAIILLILFFITIFLQ